MRWWAERTAIAAAALLAACHGRAPGPGAPSPPDPASCKVATPVCDPAVTDAFALATVERRCVGCHADGGKASHPLLAAETLLHERANVALRLAGCEMPPDASPLPADERARLIGWAACAPGGADETAK